MEDIEGRLDVRHITTVCQHREKGLGSTSRRVTTSQYWHPDIVMQENDFQIKNSGGDVSIARGR